MREHFLFDRVKKLKLIGQTTGPVRPGKLQIVYGLLCAPDGCPVAIEVFAGSTADPTTLTSQVIKLKERFGLDHVVLVGDRGMITQARISEDLKAGRGGANASVLTVH